MVPALLLLRLGAPRYVTQRWGAGAQFYVTRRDFLVTAPNSCAAEVAACRLTSNNTEQRKAVHFAHSAQNILPCWAFFCWYALLRPVILVQALNWVSSSPWVRGLLKVMGADVVTRLAPGACAVHGTLGHRPETGWGKDNMRWLGSKDDVPRLMRRFVEMHPRLSAAAAPHAAGSPLRIGVILRKGWRRFTHEADLLARIRSELPTSIVNATAMDGLSFVEQAAFVHTQDLVISPHGAQNINLLFARPCASVLEIFPRFYNVPGFYLPVASAAGAITFAAMQDGGWNSRTGSTYNFRRKARRVQIDFTGDDVARALEPMRAAHLACMRLRSERARASLMPGNRNRSSDRPTSGTGA